MNEDTWLVGDDKVNNKLIINADDFGYSVDVNAGIEYCFDKRLINRTTVMVNMPAIDDARERAERCGFLDKVGLHLNIVEGVPLTESIRHTGLCSEDGTFNNSILRMTKNRIILCKDMRLALKEEIDAQVNRFFEMGFTLRHLDSHQHSHNDLSVLGILKPVLKQHFISVRLCRNIPRNEINVLKLFYKCIINKELQKYNLDNSVKCFGTYIDVEKYLSMHRKDFVELETHPAIKNGKLIDMYNNESVEEWGNRVLRPWKE